MNSIYCVKKYHVHFRISYAMNAEDIFRSSIGCEIMYMIKARIRLIFSSYTCHLCICRMNSYNSVILILDFRILISCPSLSWLALWPERTSVKVEMVGSNLTTCPYFFQFIFLS